MLVRLLCFLVILAIALDAAGLYKLDADALPKYQVVALTLIAWAIAQGNRERLWDRPWKRAPWNKEEA